MKKLAVLSIVLLMLASLAFAEVKVEPQVAFSGSGTLTWGIDLDTLWMNGFLNEYEANLAVTFVAESTETKGSADDGMVYGYISLSDMSLIIDSDNNVDLPADMDRLGTDTDLDGDAEPATDDTPDDSYVYAPDDDTISVPTAIVVAPTIEAYVVLGPAKWFIYDAPDLEITYAAQLEDEDPDDDDTVDHWAEVEDADDVAPDFGEYGTGIEVAAGPATITAKFVSAGDWTESQSYGVGLYASATLGPATVKVGANSPLAEGADIGVGASVSVAAGPATIDAAADLLTSDPLSYEVTGGVALALPDMVDVYAKAAFSEAWSLDIEAGADLLMVANLTLGVDAGLWDVIWTGATGPKADGAAMSWGFAVDLAYQVMLGETNYVKPGVAAYISTLHSYDLRLALVGTVEAMLFPNTVFTLTYTDENLLGDEGSATLDPAGIDRELTFATKITY